VVAALVSRAVLRADRARDHAAAVQEELVGLRDELRHQEVLIWRRRAQGHAGLSPRQEWQVSALGGRISIIAQRTTLASRDPAERAAAREVLATLQRLVILAIDQANPGPLGSPADRIAIR